MYLSDTQILAIKQIIHQKITSREENEGSLKIKNVITYDLLINTLFSIRDINPDLTIKLNGNYFLN
jgi:hypothetical protein